MGPPDRLLFLLAQPSTCCLATTMPDGSPQLITGQGLAVTRTNPSTDTAPVNHCLRSGTEVR